MSNSSQYALLSMTSLEAVKNLFYSFFSRPLDERFVEFTLDKTAGELILTSKGESADGQVGGYRGSYRWRYLKADLTSLLPHPLSLQIAYPTTFRQLRTQLMARYQISLEENEFSLEVGGTGLMDDTTISTSLLEAYGQLKLYVTGDSGRFQENSFFTLIILQPTQRIPLRALFDLKAPNMLSVMASA